MGISKQSQAGKKTTDLCREQRISAARFYGWKQKFGGMDVSEPQRLKALEDENRRLELLVAELSRRGHELNVKLVYRLYVEERLMVWRKTRKRLVRARATEARLSDTPSA